jgi:hypothetical protein
MKVGSLRDAAVTGGFWSAWLLFGLAALIASPTASFCLAFLAVTAAVVPLAFGNRKQRIGAVIALLLALALAGSLGDKTRNDPYFKKHRAPQTHQTN